MSDKETRVNRLVYKIANILYTDLERYGKLKPNYMSPKFWALVQAEIRRRENADGKHQQNLD